MKRAVRITKILLFSAVFALLMAGSVFAANLSRREYKLSKAGYIAWSDFQVPSQEYVTVNVRTATVDKTGLKQNTLSSQVYEIVDQSTGKVVSRLTRYGKNRYVQVNSTPSEVYDRLTVSLPAGNYRFRVTNTQTVSQPVTLSYSVTDNRTETADYLVVTPVSVTAGQMVKVAMKNNKGQLVTVRRPASSNRAVARSKRSGNYLVVTGVGSGSCTITVTYNGKKYSFPVTVENQRPEFKAYIRNITKNGKFMYVRICNMGNLPVTFYSTGAKQYQITSTNGNRSSNTLLASLSMTSSRKRILQPGKWATIKLKRKKGLFPSTSLQNMEVWLRFRYNNKKYTAGIEDSWLDGQYRSRKLTASWYPAYSAQNNFN